MKGVPRQHLRFRRDDINQVLWDSVSLSDVGLDTHFLMEHDDHVAVLLMGDEGWLATSSKRARLVRDLYLRNRSRINWRRFLERRT